MKSKLKHLKAQLQQIYPVLKQMKGEQQELRISCLKLGTNIKPAVRGVSQQVNGLLLFSNVWLVFLVQKDLGCGCELMKTKANPINVCSKRRGCVRAIISVSVSTYGYTRARCQFETTKMFVSPTEGSEASNSLTRLHWFAYRLSTKQRPSTRRTRSSSSNIRRK